MIKQIKIFGIALLIFGCQLKNQKENTYDKKVEKPQYVKQFGEITLTGDTTIEDGFLWRIEAKLKNEVISFDTINPIEKFIELDLDKNGTKELYFQTEAMGSGENGQIYGLTKNNDGKLCEIFFPEYNEGQFDKLFSNYLGHDRYEFYPTKIIRRFPLYADNDPNCCPTLGEMTITDSLFFENGRYVMKPISNIIDKE